MSKPTLKLQGFTFAELFQPAGLQKLDAAFLKTLPQTLQQDVLAYRQETRGFSALELSTLLISTAEILEEFLINLFAIEDAAAKAQALTISYNPLSNFKKNYVLRKAKRLVSSADQLPSFNALQQQLDVLLKNAPVKTADRELALALLGNHYAANPETHTHEIEIITQWCAQALASNEGQDYVKGWTSFQLPERTDYENLVPTTKLAQDKWEKQTLSDPELRLRDGFKLTDERMQAREIQDEVNYCIYCHDHDGDFCSKGFPNKKGDPSLGIKKNPLDVDLIGCPLEEKISEMNLLKRDGHTLAALAMVMIDNPMCPATGHRICNDCMKSCIYQKQEPVNIPQIETGTLTDVLHLPWGLEIYDLLTRWNPLRQKQFLMKPYNGLKIMIAGMGPAGFTLAHHLLLEGFAVVGFDGLKIEPLPQQFIDEPIYQFDDIKEALDERIMAGFGGVAEYGITVRWDKNFLKLIYISLMRKPHFQVFGSTRFGGTVTVEDAWELGFDHFVIAVGAGLPKALSIPGSLAPGMRQANDFLMALQLGNAAKASSLTNLQVRLPAVIIGGGLTGVDTATEVQAYYITQVEKTLLRHEALVTHYGEDHVLNVLDPASREILEEFLTHGKAVRKERLSAAEENRQPNFIKLIRAWGGVTIAYRRRMQDSPAYINNHEELKLALEEGIYYADCLEPAAVDLNQYGYVETLICHKRIQLDPNTWDSMKDEIRLPARSIFVATGTQPNVAYEFEHRGTFNRLGFQYQHYEDEDDTLHVAHGIAHCKETDFGPFTSYHKGHYRVSLIGDTHPVFHGNVVKAIASGMRTYPKILKVLRNQLGKLGDEQEYHVFADKMQHLFQASVAQIERRGANLFELTIKAPLAAKHFHPGTFYRLQNYETHALQYENTILQMEPFALIAAGVDHKAGLLKFMVIESGATAKICATLKVGEPVALMGPTGVRNKIANEGETVFIIGSTVSLALLRSYGTALRASGNRVVYFGLFDNAQDNHYQDEIEKAADTVIWVTPTEDKIVPRRKQDYAVHGDLISALTAYADGSLSETECDIPLSDADRIYVIGNSQLLRQFQQARHNELKPFLNKNPRIFGSVYSTMQCMLKGVCAQCLQWQIDPETGKRTKAVFACSWPDQPLELIDFANIDDRLIQNRLQEQMSLLWVEHLMRLHPEIR